MECNGKLKRHGCENTREYLLKLSENYRISFDTVCKIADVISHDDNADTLEYILRCIRDEIEDDCKIGCGYVENMDRLKRKYNLRT